MNGWIAGLLTLAIAGCAAPLPVASITASFDRAQAEQLMRAGPNTIKGSALMRQRGGGVVTCAGTAVQLVPATEYAKERIKAIYASDQRGIAYAARFRLPSAPPGYIANTRTTMCDAQGYFVFDQVANGEFFVTTLVRWVAGNDAQGGYLMARVAPADGATVNVVLAP
jgi:hypothetical protein